MASALPPSFRSVLLRPTFSHILFEAGGVCMYRATIIAATLFALNTAYAAVDDPVRLDTGSISGTDTASPDVRVFKGIPFAAPPVGDLRWSAPKPAPHWDGV